MRRFLKKSAVVIAVAAGMLFTGNSATAICVEAGKDAPGFTLEDVDGNIVSLSDYKGKVVMIAFWASWCSRCMEEMSFLQGLYASLSNDIVVLAINQETQNLSPKHVEKLKTELKELGISFPILLDKELDVWSSFCINALPTSVILDRDGKVYFAEPNYYWASQEKITKALVDLGVLSE